MEVRVTRVNPDELYHYGVKGMKWGVRRYQNKDGTITKADKQKAKQEYKVDNKMADAFSKSATIYGHAAAKSAARTIKLKNKLDKRYAKDPTGSKRKTQSLRKKWDASAKSTSELGKNYVQKRKAAEKHCNSLIKKYGKEAIANISYKDIKLPNGKYSPKTFKTMNESTTSVSEYIVSALSMVGAVAARTMGTPIAFYTVPKTTNQKAAELEKQTYYRNYKNK